MPSGHRIPIFVSSVHYGLEDLRGELSDLLESLGAAPYVSSELGFPDSPQRAPHVGCVRALERCLIVVGVVDRRYGKPPDDWGPYPQYRGLSPTHAELKHALAEGKRLILYVRKTVQEAYKIYKANLEQGKNLTLPDGLELETLEMLRDLAEHHPAPWIETFDDTRDLKKSLGQRLLNDLHELMLQREAAAAATVKTLKDAFLESDPALRKTVLDHADADATAALQELDAELRAIAAKREQLRAAHEEKTQEVEALAVAASRIEERRAQLKRSMELSIAAALAASLTAGIRPAALHRQASDRKLPLVTDQELSRGGIHFSGFSQGRPVVTRVTWARLPRRDDDGIWRGYDAALQVYGSGFAPGCTIERRERGSADRPGRGHVPNIYSGHYLELSTNASDETPLGDLAIEFRVVNPHGDKSDWAPFTYNFDLEAEIRNAEGLLRDGKSLLEKGAHAEAIEPLRSAHVRLRGLVGADDRRWRDAHSLWREALEKRAGAV